MQKNRDNKRLCEKFFRVNPAETGGTLRANKKTPAVIILVAWYALGIKEPACALLLSGDNSSLLFASKKSAQTAMKAENAARARQSETKSEKHASNAIEQSRKAALEPVPFCFT